MIDKVEISKCCLCRACAEICPTEAIQFKNKIKGFSYPEIERDKCIGCGRCENVCPALSFRKEIHNCVPEVFVMQTNNIEVRKESTSGGVFHEVASYIIQQGGFVCGASFTEDFHVQHIVTNKSEELKSLRGSKYVQSNTSGVFKEIKNLLTEGEKVLFSGCPCQIAGLKTFLGNIPEDMYLIELVCHGIAGDDYFQGYLELQEEKHKDKLKEIRFRDKKLGWHRSSVRIKFSKGKEYLQPITVDAYMKGFLSGMVLKESCFNCQFKQGVTGSDFILGDYWGAEVEKSEIDDNTGLSAVIVNTEKGRELLRKLSVSIWESDMETVIKYNRNIVESTVKHPKREEFFWYADQYGYPKAIQDLLWEKPHEKIKRKVYFALRCLYYKFTGSGKPLY